MLLSISAHPFFCYPATRRMKGERIQEDIATYLCKWTMSTFICSQSWFMFVSISEQQNDQQIVRVLKQHKIPLGFGLLAMRCSDETAAVLCCNQRNEYTIPIVTLTCNHARDRQFRTTRTAIQLATLILPPSTRWYQFPRETKITFYGLTACSNKSIDHTSRQRIWQQRVLSFT